MAGLKRDRQSLALKLNESSSSFKRSLWKQPKEGGLMVCRVIVHRDEESRGEFMAVCVSVSPSSCVCVPDSIAGTKCSNMVEDILEPKLLQ